MNTPNITTELLKALALMQFNNETFTIKDGAAFDSEGNEIEEYIEDQYMVLTDEEADEKAKESIIESLWAFQPSFLASETGFDYEIFQAIADNGKCENNNDVIYNTIQKTCGIDSFVEEAIRADGRGHFMSSYDGQEAEETVEGITFYIYRIN